MERGECEVVGSCNTQWREMVGCVGNDDGLRTVECLRGRLLAEREASKAAKEQAQLLLERLTQLERLLAEELKCRDRAEKRLKCALKKLRSLKLVDGLGVSSSSEELARQNIGSSSSVRSEGRKTSPNSEESLMHCAEEKGKGNGVAADMDSAARSADSLCHTVSEERSWSTVGSAQSVNMGSKICSEECNQSKGDSCYWEFSTDPRRKASNSGKGSDNDRQQNERGSDDSVASAPADTKEDGENKKLKINYELKTLKTSGSINLQD